MRNAELDDLLARHTDHAAGIYQAVESALAEAGDFRIYSQKTRIAFISRMRFAPVKLVHRWVDLAFIMPHPIDDPRIRRIELYGPTSFGHHVRLGEVDQVDRTVRGWLAQALRRGDQETLNHNELSQLGLGEGGQTDAFLTADLCPPTAHIPLIPSENDHISK